MKYLVLLLLFASLFISGPVAVAGESALRYGWQSVDGIHLFYREGGNPNAPTIVFLPGNPISSIQYEGVMESLSATHSVHVISVDYPSFGYSDTPDPKHWHYTFNHIAEVVRDFLRARDVTRYALYMQDYGVPVGFRLICNDPRAISAIIVQNGVISLDGFPAAQDPNGELRRHWVQRNPAVDHRRAAYAQSITYPQAGSWHEGDTGPDVAWLAASAEQRPGVVEARNDLWFDYGNNVRQYAAWQAQLRKISVPVLVLWGRGDDYFTTPSAYAYRRFAPQAEIHILDAGHFATLQIPNTIARLIVDFFQRHRSLDREATADRKSKSFVD